MESYDELFAERSSVINIPIDLQAKDLEDMLNQQLKGVLYEDNNLRDGDKMMLRAEKKEALSLQIDSQMLIYRVPLSLWIKYDIGISKVEAEGSIALRFKTAVNLTNQWKVSTVTEIDGYEWLEKPRMKLVGVQLPITLVADLVLKNSKKKIASSMDAMVAEQFNLQKMMQDAWKQMFVPMQVSAEYNTWLTVNPQNVGITPLLLENNQIKGTIFFESKPKVKIGDRPEGIYPSNLPPLEFRNEVADNFELHINTRISYTEAERIAQAQLVGETFSQGNKSVTIQGLELYGQGNKLVVNTMLSGSYNGSIYMTGYPLYNTSKNSIDIEDLDFTLDTKNFLTKSAGWLLKSTIKKKVQDNLDFLLDYNLKDMQAQFQEQLKKYPLSDNVVLEGNLQALNLRNAYLAADAMIVDLVLQGNLNVKIQLLEE